MSYLVSTNEWIPVLAFVKGLAMTVILMAVANVTFVQGLVTVVLSSTVSGLFLLFATVLNNRPTEQIRRDVQEVHEVVNAHQTEQDQRIDQLSGALTDADVDVPAREN